MNHSGSDANSRRCMIYTPIEEAPLEIEELSPSDFLRPEATVKILADYPLSLPPSIVDNANVDGLDGNRYNLDSNSGGVEQNRRDDVDSDYEIEPTSVQRIAFSAHE